MRGSPVGRFGNIDQLLWPSCPAPGQLLGELDPRIRVFRPLAGSFVAEPVWSATHCQGCGDPHSDDVELGHVLPVLIAYCGTHPVAISCQRFGVFGSQSSDWFWLELLLPLVLPLTRR